MESASAIFWKVGQYLEGEIDLEALEDWLVPLLPVFLSLPDDSTAAQLVGVIELGRAEMSNEIIDEDELRESIQSFLASLDTIHTFVGGLQTTSGNSTTIVREADFVSIDDEPHVTVVRR